MSVIRGDKYMIDAYPLKWHSDGPARDGAGLVRQNRIGARSARANPTERREGLKTMTHTRQDLAARRRGELNRDRGSRRLWSASDGQRRLNARRALGVRTKAAPVGPSDPRFAYLTRVHDYETMPTPHSKCPECKTRLDTTEGQAEPVGDLCPVCGSLLESVGDLGEIVASRVLETRGATLHSGSWRARQLIGRGGEIIARRELRHALVRLGIERCELRSVSSPVRAVGSRAVGTRAGAVRCRRRAPLSDARFPLSRVVASAARHRSFRRGRSSAATAPPEESSLFALVGCPRGDVSLFEPRG
jgi:hypothetical protein